MTPSMRLGVLTVVAFLLRAATALREGGVIARDGAAYLGQAKRLLAGDFARLVGQTYPPGYAAWVALWGGVSGGIDERTGALASALAGALAVPALGILAARAGGRAAGLWAALLAAISPALTQLGGEVLSDALHMTLVAWCLVGVQHLLEGGRRPQLVAIGVAAAGLCAYLTRPEALVVLGVGWLCLLALPRDAGWRVRARDAGWVVAPALVALVPILIALAAYETPTGSGRGVFKLTIKQDLWGILRALQPGPYLANVLGLLLDTLKALAVAAPLVGVALCVGTARPSARRLVWLTGAVGLGLLLAFAVIRVDRRYAAQLASLALPVAGLGAAWLTQGSRRRALGLALVALALSVPFGLRPLHPRKASYRDAGRYLAAQGARRILARDSRAGFYAQAPAVAFVSVFPHAQAPGVDALFEVARREAIDALVLPLGTPEERALSEAVAARLGRVPQRFRRAGSVELDVFLLHP